MTARHYLDSSAWVKRYVAEPGHGTMRATLSDPDSLFISSRVAWPELH